MVDLVYHLDLDLITLLVKWIYILYFLQASQTCFICHFVQFSANMSQILSGVKRKLNANVISLIVGGVSSIYIGISSTANIFLIHQYQNVFQAYE